MCALIWLCYHRLRVSWTRKSYLFAHGTIHGALYPLICMLWCIVTPILAVRVHCPLRFSVVVQSTPLQVELYQLSVSASGVGFSQLVWV